MGEAREREETRAGGENAAAHHGDFILMTPVRRS
jgi:hypothetical protein